MLFRTSGAIGHIKLPGHLGGGQDYHYKFKGNAFTSGSEVTILYHRKYTMAIVLRERTVKGVRSEAGGPQVTLQKAR